MRRMVGLLLIIGALVACTAETAVDATPVTAVNTPAEPATAVTLLVVTPTAMQPTPTLNVPDTPAATEPSPPTAVPTDAPTAVLLPTNTPAPTATVPGVVYGRTAEGAFFQGYPDAPITLIDYSDFL